MEDKPHYGNPATKPPFAKVEEAAKELIAQINGLSSWTGENIYAQELDKQLNIAKVEINEWVVFVKKSLEFYLKNNTEA